MLVAVACCAMAVVRLAGAPLSRSRRWLMTAVFVIILAAFILMLQWLPGSRYAILEDFGDADGVRRMLGGAQLIGASSEYLRHGTGALDASRTGYILAAAIGAYGWLFGIGIIGVFGALLTLMIVRSTRMPHLFGRTLSVGACAYFAARYILFVMLNLGLFDRLSMHLPFVSFGSFNFLTDALLTGLFLSVWRRSSFMPRDAAVAAAPAPVSGVSPAPPIR
jgi:cell division protein FtsW (lipid II flippase)